jgi:signal transduction histidine kinase
MWAEVWDVAGPMARGVQQGGPATWTEDLQLFIQSGPMAEETYFTFSYSPIPGDDGKVGGVLNTVQETTAKVQGERQIRMLHDLAARAADAKLEDEALRAALEVLSANELDLPFVRLYRLDEAAGREKPPSPLAEILGTSGELTSRELVLDDLAGRFGELPVGSWGGRPERAVALPLLRAGQTHPYAVLIAGVSPHRALDDRYRRFFRAVADQVTAVATNARAYEAEASRAQALIEIDQAKTTFFSNVSHEFRTPLALMLGPLEDALADRQGPLVEAQRQRVAMAHDNALRLLKLVNALLDFSRIEAGRMQAHYAPADLAQLTAELAGMFQSAVEKAGLKLEIICPRLPEPTWVDREMWEKIVSNLVTNAFKFTLEGAISVRVFEDGEQVVLEVTDTGVGIPEAELPRIFERFHRVAGSAGRTHEGTGIGLSLVRELVQLHGGSVSARSKVGQGTTLRVELRKGRDHLPADAVSNAPLGARTGRDVEAQVREADRWTREGSSAPAAPLSAGARPRVLVVDDNADLREYIAGLLAPLYEVSTANDGLAALEAAQGAPPDMVVSDVMMPRLDGVGLVRELRKDPRTAQVPVILLSARAGEDATIEGLDAGSDDYLVKPFSARELLARVRTHLELQQTRRAWMAELERANRELETFSYSVSHDLRAPLRAIDGFSRALAEDLTGQLSADAQSHLARISGGVARMGVLIDALLELARVGRRDLQRQRVDLSKLAADIVAELQRAHPDRRVAVDIDDGLHVDGDPALLNIVLTNLMSNAWKFTARKPEAHIAFGRVASEDPTFFVRDDGAGFDPAYATKLFAPFQRLHSAKDFDGTGVGLATVQRVIHRHGGRIWAEAAVGQGATFSFTVPKAVR